MNSFTACLLTYLLRGEEYTMLGAFGLDGNVVTMNLAASIPSTGWRSPLFSNVNTLEFNVCSTYCYMVLCLLPKGINYFFACILANLEALLLLCN